MRTLLRRAGYELYRRPFLPKGADVFESIRAHWPSWQPSIIFDVGANVGQTIRRLQPLFPTAHIHAFEPVPEVFARLREACPTGATAHPLALSDHAGKAVMHLHRFTEQSTLDPQAAVAGKSNAGSLVVEVDTIDSVVLRLGLGRIGLLKVDVEGHELAVLKGADGMIRSGHVDFIVLEAGLIPGNPRFAPLNELAEHLLARDYWLIGIYEQFGLRFPQTAEFCNALFAHRSLLQEARS